MRFWFLFLSISVFLGASGVLAEPPYDGFGVPTTEADWDECALEYTAQCPPTIPIEQAACEAPLIVNGRVLQAVNGETRQDTVVQIQVEYLSEFFGSTDRKTIQKWGAGLENDEGGSIFLNSSGFFTTWIVESFNNTPTDLETAGFGTTPCGTRSPQSQETLFFFLKGLPEFEGTKVAFADDQGTLNVNFSLSTSILQTGILDDNADTYDLVATGAFTADNRLDGTCEAVYCCYNPGCDRCSNILAEAGQDFTCEATFATNGSSSSQSLFGSSRMLGLLLLLLSGVIAWTTGY